MSEKLKNPEGYSWVELFINPFNKTKVAYKMQEDIIKGYKMKT